MNCTEGKRRNCTQTKINELKSFNSTAFFSLSRKLANYFFRFFSLSLFILLVRLTSTSLWTWWKAIAQSFFFLFFLLFYFFFLIVGVFFLLNFFASTGIGTRIFTAATRTRRHHLQLILLFWWKSTMVFRVWNGGGGWRMRDREISLEQSIEFVTSGFNAMRACAWNMLFTNAASSSIEPHTRTKQQQVHTHLFLHILSEYTNANNVVDWFLHLYLLCVLRSCTFHPCTYGGDWRRCKRLHRNTRWALHTHIMLATSIQPLQIN